MRWHTRWSDLSLRAKGVFVVAVPATATVIIACFSYAVGARATAAEHWANHTLQASEKIQRLETSEAAASSEFRAYIITGDEAFHVRMWQTLAAFDATRQELLTLTADNRAQKERLARIDELERPRVARLFSAAAQFQRNPKPEKELRAAVLASDRERHQIGAIIQAMREDEKRLLEAHLQRADVLHSRMQAISGVCLVLGVVGGVVISLLFASGITFRIERLSENVALLATGGTLDPMPEGQDEIGALAQGVAKAAEILRHALHGVAQADAGGRHLSFNQTYAELTGLPTSAGSPDVLGIIHPADRAQVEGAIEQMLAGGRGETEARVLGPGGAVADTAITILAAGPARDDGYYVFVRDISAQKETEAALIRAKDGAVAATAAKSNFLEKISHDIRTPLNAILGAADLLSGTSLDADQADYVDMFQRNCRRLVALINDFLDFGRIEAGAMRLDKTPYKVRQAVYDAVHTFAETAGREHVDLRLDISENVPDWQLGDPLRIQQILMNLVSNALKFSPGGRVGVKVFIPSGLPNRQLRFEISDSGPGIQAEDREKIFSPFMQLPNQPKVALPSSGLGLTICRELVQLMGGDIGVTSAPGLGSTFYFGVPLITAGPGAGKPPAVARAQPPARTGTALRLLVAEDGEDNRSLMQYYLRGEPVTVRFAENGQVAVDIVLGGAVFDLILMDLDMPVLDGYAATRAIREWQAARGIAPTPIIAVSAHALEELVRASLEAGCNAHLAKPIERTVLIDTIFRHTLPAGPLKSVVAVTEGASDAISPEVAELVPQYLASKWRQMEAAQASLMKHDFDPIRRFGHNLRGTGRGYGFPPLEQIGHELEVAASSGEEEQMAEQLERLRCFLNEESVPA